MRLLLVFPFLPYPPDDGGRIGFFNPIKYVSRKNEVAVVCLTEEKDQRVSIAHASELKGFCAAVETFRQRRKGHLWALAGGLMMNPPGSLAKYWEPKFGDFLVECIERYSPDLVELHHLSMAAYARYIPPSVPVILREHNVEYKVWERQSRCARSWPERAYVRLAAPRIREYEGDIASRFARCITVSEADARHLSAISPQARIEVIPSGVDTEYFRPAENSWEEPYSLTITGSFDWPPKQHSLWILLTEIFPRIKSRVPKAKLYVVGKGVPRKIRDRAQQIPDVVVTGMVDDVRPYLSRTSVVLQYLESGGGIALKVLEAMAMRKPVLSNPLGCEGIDIEGGRDCFLADGIANFVDAAGELLTNKCLRLRLADGGYRRILDSYAWERIVNKLEQSYSNVLNEFAESNDKRLNSVLAERIATLSSPRLADSSSHPSQS